MFACMHTLTVQQYRDQLLSLACSKCDHSLVHTYVARAALTRTTRKQSMKPCLSTTMQCPK